MGSLKNNDILRCSYFSVTGIGVAGSLMLLEVVSWVQSWSVAVGITPYQNCRGPACELDTTSLFCISSEAFHALSCSLSFQRAGWFWEFCHHEGAVSSKCEKLWNCWNEYVGPSCRFVRCSQFGVAPNDFPSRVKRELYSTHCCSPYIDSCILIWTFLWFSASLYKLQLIYVACGQNDLCMTMSW